LAVRPVKSFLHTSMSMSTTKLLLVSLACAGLGRRVQNPGTLREELQKLSSSAQLSDAQGLEQPTENRSLKLLTALLLAIRDPAAAWQSVQLGGGSATSHLQSDRSKSLSAVVMRPYREENRAPRRAPRRHANVPYQPEEVEDRHAWKEPRAPKAPKIDKGPLIEERRVLRGVIGIAIEQQQWKREVLKEKRKRSGGAPSMFIDSDDFKEAYALQQRHAEQIDQRIERTDMTEERLLELRDSLFDSNLTEVRRTLEEELRLGKRLQKYDFNASRHAQWGRPEGFGGLVIRSPRGLPILVERKNMKDKKSLMNLAKRSDQWFQIHDGKGPRVLLRTSMVPGISKGYRECMEMAADLAAYFSREYKDEKPWLRPETFKVYWTGPQRHKGGRRIGKVKKNEIFGRVVAKPDRVHNLARDAQEIQGWLYS